MEIRNVFDDPEEVLRMAKQQTFVLRNAHYHNTDRNTYYNGVRSKNLIDINEDFANKIHEQVSSKIIQTRFKDDLETVKIQFGFQWHAYFHIMREQDKFDKSWLHKDSISLLAGVVYLNPNPRPNTGTIVYMDGDDKEPTVVENEYNKLVLYNGSFLHAPQNGFGTDINDSRLTMVFFMSDIKIMAGFANIGQQ